MNELDRVLKSLCGIMDMIHDSTFDNKDVAIDALITRINDMIQTAYWLGIITGEEGMTLKKQTEDYS
jgi:hypothetical protein